MSKYIAINGVDDMVEGCGLAITPKVLSIESIDSKNLYFVETNICQSRVKAALDLEFNFEAGYTITGEYTAFVAGLPRSKHAVLTDTQDCINLIEQSELHFDILENDSYQLPFNNWRVLAHNKETINDIKSISGDGWDELHDDSIIFTRDDECGEVAYGLLNNINKRIECSTGLTAPVVQELHDNVKKAMIDALLKRDEKMKLLRSKK